jgi:hypothetical protein
MANVAFDYTNLVDSIGGIGDGELRDLRPRLDEAVTDLSRRPARIHAPPGDQ